MDQLNEVLQRNVAKLSKLSERERDMMPAGTAPLPSVEEVRRIVSLCKDIIFTDYFHKRQSDEKMRSYHIGVSMDELRELNSQYIHDIIPGKEQPYVLKLGYQYSNSFIDCQDSLYTHLADSLLSPKVIKGIEEGTALPSGNVIRYKVKSGDYLGRIAARYHVSVKQLMSWNGLRSTNLRVGQVLTIYSGGAAPSQEKSDFTPPKSPYAADTYTGPYEIYTVKAGDSMYSIARNFSGISANDIMAFNNCSSSLKPGQQLKIPTP